MTKVLVVVVIALALVSSAGASQSTWRLGQWSPGVHNVENAIYYHFCGKRYVRCALGSEAWNVSGCETGGTYTTWSSNGQYLGLFQMGSGERKQWGFGNNAWAQAAAAYRMYLWTSTHERGGRWHRWSCQP